MSTATLDRAEPTTQSSAPPPYGICQVIRSERRIREQLKADEERHERNVAAQRSALAHLDWLRRCHRDGFDVERLTGAFAAYRIEGDLREIPAEAVEEMIQRTADLGCCYFRDTDALFVRNEVPDDPEGVDATERDAVIYLLANLHRLPPLTEPQPEVIQAPRSDADLTHRLGAALNGLVERLRVNRVRVFAGLDFTAEAALTSALQHAEAALEAWNPDPFQDE